MKSSVVPQRPPEVKEKVKVKTKVTNYTLQKKEGGGNRSRKSYPQAAERGQKGKAIRSIFASYVYVRISSPVRSLSECNVLLYNA